MVWLEGHAVCSGCDHYWQKCECVETPVALAADGSLAAR